MASSSNNNVSGWVGWVYFAGFMMLLAATFQMIAGLAALFKDDVYLVGERALLTFDYSQWGWVHITIGLILLLSALSLFAGNWWGRAFGVLVAGLSIVGNFAFMAAYPLWSITIIVVDALIIYALIVHGGDAKDM